MELPTLMQIGQGVWRQSMMMHFAVDELLHATRSVVGNEGQLDASNW